MSLEINCTTKLDSDGALCIDCKVRISYVQAGSLGLKPDCLRSAGVDALLSTCTSWRAVKAPPGGRGSVPLCTPVSLRAISSRLHGFNRPCWLACLPDLACTGDPLTSSLESVLHFSVAGCLFVVSVPDPRLPCLPGCQLECLLSHFLLADSKLFWLVTLEWVPSQLDCMTQRVFCLSGL